MQSAHVDTMTLQILQRKLQPAPAKPEKQEEDEKDYMKMLKDTVETFKKKSQSRQRSAYAVNLSVQNPDVSITNQSAYDALIQDPSIVKAAVREAKVGRMEHRK